MMLAIKRLISAALLAACFLGTGAASGFVASPVHASEIKYIVNDIPVTSYDIARRAAFLKLQQRSGGAAEAMIEQALQVSEITRRGIKITEQQVDDAYARFASGNKLSVAQVDQIMAQSGVTKAHFKDYIRAQMGWSQVLGAKVRNEARVTEQDAAHRMLQQGGTKPTATEYMLQQVIFVVPESERSSQMGKRKREAEAMRARFNGCDSTRDFAKGLLDVTVRDLGKVLAPQLPPDWSESIKAISTGKATPVRETERGVEFIGICSSREVSDDRVAQMVFQNEIAGEDKSSKLAEEYLAELRKNARIIER